MSSSTDLSAISSASSSASGMRRVRRRGAGGLSIQVSATRLAASPTRRCLQTRRAARDFNAALTQVHARMGRPMSMCRLHGDSHPARLGIYRLFPYLHRKNPEPCLHPLCTCRTEFFFFFFDSACESSAAIKEREKKFLVFVVVCGRKCDPSH